MKKIHLLMMMLALCCVNTVAQTPEWADKLIKMGPAQDKMVPGQWYFLHNPRHSQVVENGHSMPGEYVQPIGGLVSDKGVGVDMQMSTTSEMDVLSSEDGVSANDNKDKLVRFVAVDGVEGAYNIQFGTGNWIGNFPDASNSAKLSTVNNNQYLSGQAGQYNFYLISLNGKPNVAGRFGWNRHNMAQRVDNNGAGSAVVFWGSGEIKTDGQDISASTDNDIKGNNVWQIYSVEICGEENIYASAFQAMLDIYDEIYNLNDGQFVSNLQKNVNVGNSYGNYRPENVKAFLDFYARVEEIRLAMDQGADDDYLQSLFPTVEDLEAFNNEFRAVYDNLIEDKVPRAVSDIVPGYYTINSVFEWTVTLRDTVYFTQAECDELNAESGLVAGDEGFLTPSTIKEVKENIVPAPMKAVCSQDDADGQPWLAWGSLEAKSEFLWKIEKVDGSNTEYRLINMHKGLTFSAIPTSDPARMVEDDTVTVLFDYRDSVMVTATGKKELAYSIRTTYGSEGDDGYHCIHCGEHANGKGTGGRVVGWSGDSGASQWYLSPVDDNTADLWMNGDEAKLRAMIVAAERIITTAPAQIEVAKDIVVTVFENDSVVTDASQFHSNSLSKECDSNDPYSVLLDGNPATFWHSAWENGNVPVHTHYLQVEANAPLEGIYSVKVLRRAIAGYDHPTKLAVRGYDANDDALTFEDGEDLGVLDIPFNGVGTIESATNLFNAKGKSVLRFYWEASNNPQRGYWHCSGFNIFRAEEGTVNEKTQYQVRSEIITRLQAAMDKWNAAGYSVDNVGLVNDPEFNAAYNELIEANEAWKAVYVNPAALREAIASAPAENLFVTGNNPGQWKAGAVTPEATVREAKAYDENAAYTPAESERLIKAITDVTAEAFAAANKVETGKWYRFKFPTEEMYDTYGWSKAGVNNRRNETAGVDVSPALFGKTVAAGKGVTEYVVYPNAEDESIMDTLATYKAEYTENLFNGNGLYYFDDEQMADMNNGEDLFRFIQATDTSYIIQNKATGLFLRGGRPVSLSDVPTYFCSEALGAGTNLITYTSILGEEPQHCNLHGQLTDNRLVCWESNTIGSNSALLIEEVEDVTEEPSTVYSTKLWPGSVYAYTKPVDVTISADAEAVAYGAELTVDEPDTVVILKKIEAETIKAGTPYILIANETHDEYITPADRLAQIAAGYDNYGYFEKQEAAELRDDEYVVIEMDHGMVVDTLQKGNGNLVGTFRSLTVEAGKGIVTKDNGFAHTLIDTTVDAYGAYIKCDFDSESADVLSTITIKVEGSVETGITDAINKVVKSGNIYTVDGKLVGKGNINAINNLPAGVYIVNGVKVTKR